jgi:DNA helicase-2/ATP-dependent DNA helicase PcrA
VVENNKARKGKKLWTEAQAGEKIGVYAGFDGENEALFIADSIERLLGAHPEDHVAVLYRTNFQSRQIEEALRRYGRKYNVVGGFSFYQRAEIRDIIAYLKLATSQSDSASLTRIINTPARGIGRTTIEQVEGAAREWHLGLWNAMERVIDSEKLSTRSQSSLANFRNLIRELALVASSEPLPHVIKFIIEHTGYRRMLEEDRSPDAESRLGNLQELVNAAAEAAERGDSVVDFLDHAALVAEADAYDQTAPVTLMTVHNAKGLEFPVVFLAGMEHGLFPHSRSINSPEALEEERRLCYVGMTRARKRLFLTWARYRRRFGGGEQERSIPSSFLKEVPQELVVNLGPQDDHGEVELFAERYDVRQSAQRNTFTGKTYNSIANISQFFNERGIPFNAPKPGSTRPPEPLRAAPPGVRQGAGSVQQPPPRPATGGSQSPLRGAPRKAPRTGMTVEHPKYGTGTVVQREGEGENAKITVNFPGFGLKKLIEKYAGLKRN